MVLAAAFGPLPALPFEAPFVALPAALPPAFPLALPDALRCPSDVCTEEARFSRLQVLEPGGCHVGGAACECATSVKSLAHMLVEYVAVCRCPSDVTLPTVLLRALAGDGVLSRNGFLLLC